MIKKIKFFVRINGVPCHTLEDLQNNFYLQDVMSLHREGVLRRWLISNDEGALADKVKQLDIDEDNNAELAKSLVEILCPNFSKDSLNDALNYFYFEKKQSDLAVQRQQNRDYTAKSIELHFKNFNHLLDGIVKTIELHLKNFNHLLLEIYDHKHDFSFLCHSAILLVDNYWPIIDSDIEHYISKFEKEVPCIFFPLIALGKFRSNNSVDKAYRDYITSHIYRATMPSKDKATWYGRLCGAINEDVEAPSNFFFVEKAVDFWDDLVEDDNTKVMVLRMEATSTRVRGVKASHEFTSKNVNNMFPIFNGLSYKGSYKLSHVAYLVLPDTIADRCCSHDSEVKDQLEEILKSNEEANCGDKLHDVFSNLFVLLLEHPELISKSINDLLGAMKK